MDLFSAAIQIPEIPVNRMTEEDYNKWRIDYYNKKQGSLTGYNCSKCLNRGFFYFMDAEGYVRQKECECMKTRRSYTAIANSGLADLVETRTFEAFNASEDWQQRMKATAIHYTKVSKEEWLFVSGQSGCGKTHICTAVCRHLMENGRTVKYMLWNDIFQKLEANKYNDERYSEFMKELKSVDVLYIDDFLKTEIKNNVYVEPPIAEVKQGYNVINARYLANKKTIISAEFFIDEMSKIDCAIAGRIKQKCGNYCIQSKREETRNYRLKGI